MALENVCSPAIIYVAFSFIHILIDIIKSSYDDALSKFCIMIVFTTILNILCERGLGVISWFIVFIPFITMTLLSQILLMVLKRPDGDQDKKMTDIDKINLLRSGSGEEPEPAIEFSECKSKKCDPGNASSSYTIDPNEHVHAVTDSLSFAYKNAMNTESGAAADAGAGADAGAADAGCMPADCITWSCKCLGGAWPTSMHACKLIVLRCWLHASLLHPWSRKGQWSLVCMHAAAVLKGGHVA